MKILLTNDDGISAIGLRALAEWSRKLGDVIVAAPKHEQSGRSHGIVLHQSYEIKEIPAFSDLGIVSVAVDATPADCVRYMVDKYGASFDIVFSGINDGFNIGYDISYSATCGAAFEANCAGIKAISFSASRGTIPQITKHLDEVWEHINNNGYLDAADLLNVNIPVDHKGILVTEQAGIFYRDHFVNVGGDMYKAQVYLTRDLRGKFDLRYDADAVLSGYCSITPLTVKKTDREALEKMKR